MQTGFFEAMTQPVAGLTLLVFMAASCPLPAIAQLPTRQQRQIPARLNNSVWQPQTAYVIGGGDRLFIDIFQVTQYSGEYQVPIDGVLYLPLIGGISVQDLTLEQATNAISSAYAAFLNRPGSYILVGAATQNNNSTGITGGLPTVTAAIQQAKGILSEADIRRVNPDGTVTREELPINFAQNVNEQTNPILRENDIIVVCRSSSTRITDTLGLLLNPAGSILAALSIPDRIAGILALLGIIDRDDDD
jgi:polysaccharide export outer membrane protein